MKIVLLCTEDFSLGIASLSAYLKSKGHIVKVLFDPKQFEKAYAQNKFLSNAFNRRELILHRIKEFSPDLIGLSVFSSNYQWSLEMAKSIKAIIDCPVIFGGVHPTLVPESVIGEESVDMVCVGEGEEPLSELLQSMAVGKIDYSIKNIWFKKSGSIIKNEIRPLIEDLDSLPYPDREALYAQLPPSYSKHPIFLTSYGCPYRCTYCANNAISKIYKGKGKYLRRRSPDNVIEEIKQVKQKHDPKYIIFMDDLFTFDKVWLKEFASKYSKTIDLPYSCLTHTKFIDHEVCKLLRASNCNIVLLGLQSGSDKIRREILNRPESNDEYRKATGWLKGEGIKFSLDNILNVPFDTEETILESLAFYNELRPDIVHSFSLVYFPKTKIIDYGIEAGLLSPQARDLIDRGSNQGYMSVQLNTEGYFRKYVTLFTMTPLFSADTMRLIIKNPRLRGVVGKLPMVFVLLIKFILNIRAGTGFIFFSVLGNEWFYMKETIYQKWMLKRQLKRT